MLGNCEKTMTATNQWTLQQDQIVVDYQNTFMASTSKGKVMEKTTIHDHHQRQLPLNCPRCDSSNTKFCYYNNYSLSQPRHFCKACKRYWTRGGTLRNVPVGGGCRKNKRVVQRPPHPSNGGDVISASKSTATTSPTSNHINNSMFYPGLNFPFCNGYDIHQPQMNGLGLGFVQRNEFKDGFNPVKKIEGVIGTSNPSVAIDPILLLANSNFPGLMPCDGMQVPQENVVEEREYKKEGQNRLDWNIYHQQFLWNTSNVGSWFEPSNAGSSSVPSLI